MKAYKFRDSKNITYAFDVIINKRLYCSEATLLNDPSEGVFCYSCFDEQGDQAKASAQKIIEQKRDLRICSLSKTVQSHLLWVHYAGGFDGLAIEVEIPEHEESLVHVIYEDAPFGHLDCSGSTTNESALNMFSRKWNPWSYEEEVRIIQKDMWYEVSQISRVILGFRMDESLQEAIKTVCSAHGIPTGKPIITDIGLQIF